MFYGNLDAAGLALLPQTISNLGVSIASTSDAAAVAAFKPWSRLSYLSEPMHVCCKYNNHMLYHKKNNVIIIKTIKRTTCRFGFKYFIINLPVSYVYITNPQHPFWCALYSIFSFNLINRSLLLSEALSNIQQRIMETIWPSIRGYSIFNKFILSWAQLYGPSIGAILSHLRTLAA